jgi:hypothetical protein
MITHYLETRGRIHNAPAHVVADIMRHLHARQHLGRAVVVCDEPAELVELAHKQWLKLSRMLQRRRGSATNAVEILKYTYTITQMQHVVFSAQPPHEQPEARVFFVQPQGLKLVPTDCLSIYVTAEMTAKYLARMVAEVSASALVVDYTGEMSVGDFGLRAKTELEAQVIEHWRRVEAFLTAQQIEMHHLVTAANPTEMMEDALDILLGVSEEFLQIASGFARVLDLARPLRMISKAQRSEYEVFMMLAHRVQTLAPGGFSTRFLDTYADDAFFLNDNQTAHALAEAIDRQRRAGRLNVARALLQLQPQHQQWLVPA